MTPDELLDRFIATVTARGLELYGAQEEAILELLSGSNVILTTPTGSGKSLVAEALHHAALAQGRRSYYTAPIKALVSEKFFALCRTFGSDLVGMVTGDAAVNPDAPIVCCTAEILANRALRLGAAAAADAVVMDEFHFYADPQRGVAWQLPLLLLPESQFLLMSATMGPTDFFVADLTRRTGRPTVEVTSTTRPVPLDFEYRDTPLLESLQELVELDRAPVYIVHFTQKAAMEAAQSLSSLDVLTKAEKARLWDTVGGFRFDSPVGKDVRRWLGHGIGIHHAGLLPKYRLLVEKLAQEGLLKLICGTDTLGVGVNVPIRSVLFTQLCKFDGTDTRVLTVREFRQIAGRAGRKGFDDRGHVWVQAPAHWIENRRMDAKVANDPAKRKKLVKRKPPEFGYAHWNEGTFTRLTTSPPEALESSFRVNHQMVMSVLDRNGDGAAVLKDLLLDNHEPRARQRRHIRRAIQVYRSLVAAEVIEALPEPTADGRRVRVTVDLQDEFALHQPLSLFAMESVADLDPASPSYALDVVSVVEAVMENPMPVLTAQLDRAKRELLAQLKADGMEYDGRMAELAQVEYPKPLGEWLWTGFRAFRAHHPWVGDESIRPKSVARELFELGFTFRDYVEFHGLKRSEGLLLRYLSDAYKGLVQIVPETAKTEEVWDLEDWLSELVRQVDSSLVDEWERLRAPDLATAGGAAAPLEVERRDVTTNARAFRIMVRNAAFRWVTLLARRDFEGLAESPRGDGQRWRGAELAATFAPYWDEHGAVPTGGDARGPAYFEYDEGAGRVRQIVADPAGFNEWQFLGRVDLAASRASGEAVLVLERAGRDDLG
jgi:superfamily II RNA helicase